MDPAFQYRDAFPSPTQNSYFVAVSVLSVSLWFRRDSLLTAEISASFKIPGIAGGGLSPPFRAFQFAGVVRERFLHEAALIAIGYQSLVEWDPRQFWPCRG